MKGITIRKAVVLLVTLVMAVSMGACSASTPTATTAPTTAPTAAPTAAPTTAAATATPEPTPEPTPTPVPRQDPFGKYDPPITINVARSLGQEITFAAGEDINNNIWTRTYLDQLGIKINHVWTVPDDQYDKKVSLVIASNDIPDMMPVAAKELKMLVEGGVIQDLTDVMQTYGSDTLLQRVKDDPNAIKIGTFNGKLMALPTLGTSNEDAANVLNIRKDWLDKLGLPVPTTMDEFWADSQKFVENKLGGDTTYAVAISKELFGQDLADMKGIFNGYHAYPDMWIDDGTGKLVYGSIQPQVKTVLAKMQQLYAAGMLDKQFAVKDRWKVGEDIAAGRVGAFFGAAWSIGYSGGANLANDPKADWIALKLLSADGQPALAGVKDDSTGKHFYIVNKSFKNPEALIKMDNLDAKIMDDKSLANQQKYGEDDVKGLYFFKYIFIEANQSHYNADHTGQVNDAFPQYKDDPSKAPDALKADITTLASAIANKATKPADYGWSVYLMLGDYASFNVINQYRKNNQILVDKFIGQPTDTMVEKGTSLYDKSIEVFTKIIMGDPIDNFDSFVAEWKSTGGDQITQEVNDWYASFQKQ